jgi:ectoine hydroxylase-related dioxygenase (phytanoyl-CoA dioxygenase family)
MTGPTLVWPGSHRSPNFNPESLEPEKPMLSLGDCLLMDYRLVHGGAANQSDQVRPILYNIYFRPWFRDYINYSKQRRLEISREALNQVPPQYRHLFAHVASARPDSR